MKKVLIITYYWPPSGGGGVQRWLKFVKYLREFGWEPVVYTPENPEMPAVDESLLKEIPEGIEVIKSKIWEPYLLYKKFTGKKEEQRINTGFISEGEKPLWTENIAVWIRGNLFIPDARKFWIRPSVKLLKKYLKDNRIDAIVSTGPPHSMHLIAFGLKQSTNLPWVADFRDPWTNIDFYNKLKLSAYADKKHNRKEQQVIQYADLLTTVSWRWASDFDKLGAKNVKVITNGFDPEDFNSIGNEVSGKFELCHFGSINKDRNPNLLWDVLGDLSGKIQGFKEDLKITLIGSTDHQVFECLKNNKLIDNTNYINYLSHEDVLKRSGMSTVLLLPLNDTPNVLGIIPGKVFEYLALKKPILCIGPVSGDSSRVIKETNSGETVEFGEKDEMTRIIVNYYKEFKEYGSVQIAGSNINNYSRKELTRNMAKLLDEII